MLKLPLTVVSQPLGGPDGGAMPSSTAWATLAAAKSSGASKFAMRIVTSVGDSSEEGR